MDRDGMPPHSGTSPIPDSIMSPAGELEYDARHTVNAIAAHDDFEEMSTPDKLRWIAERTEQMHAYTEGSIIRERSRDEFSHNMYELLVLRCPGSAKIQKISPYSKKHSHG